MKLRALTLVAALAFVPGCSASQSQIQKTEEDGFKLAGCVLSEIFAGTTDPGAIAGQCWDAAPALIIDIINDFEAQHGDAGAAATLGPEQAARRALLDKAKAAAVGKLAEKASSK